MFICVYLWFQSLAPASLPPLPLALPVVIALGPKEIHVLVVIPDKEDGDRYGDSREQARAFERSGARVTMFHLEKRRSPISLFRARQRLKHLTGKARPDVVHVHFGSVTAIWAVFSSSMPVVVTFMGDDLDRSNVKGVARPFIGGLSMVMTATSPCMEY